MPTSTIAHLTDAVRHIIITNPKSVLDIGVGYGRWGYLCREVLDAAHERFRPETWQARIEGIEIFEPYVLDHQRFLYNQIHIGNAYDVIDGLGEYDLIIAGDVVEHLERKQAEALLRKIYNRARKGFILNLPIGQEWLRDFTDHENHHESHLSAWELSDFEDLRHKEQSYHLGHGGEYALIFFDEQDLRFNRCYLNMKDKFTEKQFEEADKCFTIFTDTITGSEEPYLLYLEALIQHARIHDCVRVFDQMLQRVPEFIHGYGMFLDFLKNTGNASLMQEKGKTFLNLDIPEEAKSTIRTKLA